MGPESWPRLARALNWVWYIGVTRDPNTGAIGVTGAMVLGCLMVLASEGATVVTVEEGEAEYRKGVGVTLLKGSGEGLLKEAGGRTLE